MQNGSPSRSPPARPRGSRAKVVSDYQQALKLGLQPADERTALTCLASSHPATLGELVEAQTVIHRARRQPRLGVRILGLALPENAASNALAGFDAALVRSSGVSPATSPPRRRLSRVAPAL